MKDNEHEQLFTELTPAEAAVVEGGIRLTIDRIQAIKAGADFIGADDTYITVNGKKIAGDFTMTTGLTQLVNKSITTPGSSAVVRLWDNDPLNPDDLLGVFAAVNTNGRQRQVRLSGSGSIYNVYYRATA